MSPNNDPVVSIDINNELAKNISIHKNVRQEIVLTTADKIKLVLINVRDCISAQRDWWTPLGLLMSFVATLCTADFKQTFGLSQDFWQALFVFFTIFSFLWLLKDLRKLYLNWGKDDLDKIILQIKLDSESTTNETQNQINE